MKEHYNIIPFARGQHWTGKQLAIPSFLQ